MTHPASPRRRIRIAATAIATLAIGLTLSGCAANSPEPAASPSASQPAADDVLAGHDLAGLDAVQIIERLDKMAVADRPADLMASVRPDFLVVTDDQQRETRLAMPSSEVYISVAPYVDQTHECYFHSLTTCQGELGNEEVKVTLVSSDGEVLVDEVRQTYDNGFTGFWLPRGIEATLSVERAGQTGSVELSTMNDDDATCVTTLQLS